MQYKHKKRISTYTFGVHTFSNFRAVSVVAEMSEGLSHNLTKFFCFASGLCIPSLLKAWHFVVAGARRRERGHAS